jgi:hypothetical protein
VPRCPPGHEPSATCHNGIHRNSIGEADGLFVAQGRFLIHWPTLRARQFKPREKLRGQVPDFLEEAEMALLETDRLGRLRIGFKNYDGLKCREPLGVQANKQTIADAGSALRDDTGGIALVRFTAASTRRGRRSRRLPMRHRAPLPRLGPSVERLPRLPSSRCLRARRRPRTFITRAPGAAA